MSIAHGETWWEAHHTPPCNVAPVLDNLALLASVDPLSQRMAEFLDRTGPRSGMQDVDRMALSWHLYQYALLVERDEARLGHGA
jgi:hypothetical protein